MTSPSVEHTPSDSEVSAQYRALAQTRPLGVTYSQALRLRRAEYDRWLRAHDESVFRAGWQASGEGYNGEYPDEGVPWDRSAGHEAFERWMSDPQRRNGE